MAGRAGAVRLSGLTGDGEKAVLAQDQPAIRALQCLEETVCRLGAVASHAGADLGQGRQFQRQRQDPCSGKGLRDPVGRGRIDDQHVGLALDQGRERRAAERLMRVRQHGAVKASAAAAEILPASGFFGLEPLQEGCGIVAAGDCAGCCWR